MRKILTLIVICLGFVATSKAQTPPVCTFAQVAFNSVNNTFEYHCPNTNNWFVATVNGSGGGGTGGGLQDPGANGIVLRTSLDITTIASSSDIISLFGGTCTDTTFLRGDGTCSGISTFTYPPAGIAVSPGSSGPWSTSLQTGVSAANLVQLDNLGRLPAVSAQNLTNFPTFNQSTTGNAATATALSATPVICGPNQASRGILTNGNATGCQAVPSSPAVATAIKYAAGSCATGPCVDTNDGLSWGTAKLTITGALKTLPGGSSGTFATAGSGTVFVGPGAISNDAGSQYGIWLMGCNDPAAPCSGGGSVPTGWLRGFGGSTGINIVGVPNATTGPNAHRPRVNINASGGGSDTTHPAVWLSGWNSSTNISNLEFSYPGRVFVIGECSNGLRNDTCQSSAITFDNDGGIVNTAIATNGPCTDIVSGVFWVYFRDFSCGGMGSAAVGGITSNKAAGILMDGTLDTGDGVEITDSNLSGGGLKVIPGSNGFSLYVSNLTLEGNFSNPLPPVVWMTDYFAGCDARLDEINQADAGGGSMPIIQNDGANYGNGVVAGPTVFNSQAPPQGPSTTINPRSAQLMTVDPLVYGSAGFFNKYVVGQTNVARRIGGITPSRFLNKADANTVNWTNTNTSGSQTITLGVTDPFGGTLAATASSSAATTEYLQMGPCASYVPVAGDWILIGEWEKNVPLGDYFVGGCVGSAFPVMSATYKNRGMMQGNNNWEFIWTAYKVSSGGSTNIGIAQIFTNTVIPTVYGPVLYVIPSGTLTDNEVIEFATSMNSIDKNCPVGSMCNVAGHPLIVDKYGTQKNCAVNSVSPAACGSSASGAFVVPTTTSTYTVNTTAVTAASRIFLIPTTDASNLPSTPTCVAPPTGFIAIQSARVAGTSFTFTLPSTTGQSCWNYWIIN